ncbi:MAG: PAS domain S-box protein, partial [Chloroflexota bacterium]|nr:PAS domain S-box protein [Chloroflexota bacterium]
MARDGGRARSAGECHAGGDQQGSGGGRRAPAARLDGAARRHRRLRQPFWRHYTGLSWEASLGGGWANAVHPDDVALIDARWRAAAKTGEAYEIEYRFRRSDGVYRWHLAHVAAICHPSGTVSRWVGTAIDIDDRRQAEAALRASEARYRDVVENATDIAYTLLVDGTVAAVNPAIERVLGYRPEELIGRSVETIIAPEHLARTREVLGRKMAGEEVSAYDLDLIAKDGRHVTVEVNSRRALVDGRPVAVHGIARDVSTRRALEREQQEFLEAVSHDLKNPLTAVRGQAQHLRRQLRRTS